jgi:hypothetical protein
MQKVLQAQVNKHSKINKTIYIFIEVGKSLAARIYYEHF